MSRTHSLSSKKLEWSNKINQWRLSGKSAKAWCHENDEVYTTFLGWRNRLNQTTPLEEFSCAEQPLNAPRFVELKDQPSLFSPLILEYAGAKIHLLGDFDASVLKKCLSVLRGGIC